MKLLANGNKRAAGSLLAAALSVITAAVYAIIYASTRFMSWEAFWFLLGGTVVVLPLLLLKKPRFAPTVLLTTGFIGCMFYVYNIYFFVSSVVVGIQFSGFPPTFFVNIVFFVATIIADIAAVFLPDSAKN